jgi:hypothetical protein
MAVAIGWSSASPSSATLGRHLRFIFGPVPGESQKDIVERWPPQRNVCNFNVRTIKGSNGIDENR